MIKSTFFKNLWIVILGLATPLTAFDCLESCKPGWNFSDAVLYWYGNEQGLGFTNKPADILTTNDFTQNSVVNPTFKWEWGFRLGIGYTEPNRQWTFKGFWTSIESKAHGHKYVNPGAPDYEGIFPIWSMSPDTLVGDYVTQANSNWHVHTNIGDLIAQYNFACFCDELTLMPFAGLRGVVLSQKLTAKYSGGTFFTGLDVNTLHNRYYGGGPRFGLNVDYYLACGFSIFGRGAVAPLFGAFHIKQKEKYLDALRYSSHNIAHNSMLSTDYEIGLRWKGLVIETWPFVVLSIAWEGQEFFYANKFRRGNYGFFSRDRALFLQGLTFNAALDF